MPVNRRLWTSYLFTEKQTPSWQCPTCGMGTLIIKPGSLVDESDRGSKKALERLDWEPFFWSGRFCCLFECSNIQCKDVVAVIGRAENTESENELWISRYYPTAIYPPLHIINIPETCPRNVADEMKAAFALFWSDLAGAMNHFRKSVELILTHLKIPKKKRNNKGKLISLTLHRRIELFEDKNIELANRLEAVKWLGNVGSHSGEVSINDFYDACDLLEDFILTHFERHGDRIRAITKKVNRKYRRS